MKATVFSASRHGRWCFVFRRRLSFFGIAVAVALELTALSPTAAQAVCADSATTPRLDAGPAVVCELGQPCIVSIDLSLAAAPNEESVKATSATLTSDKAITCATCSVESPAGYGDCIFNPAACAFFLGDPFDQIQEFAEGTLATISLTCDAGGIHSLDLTGTSFSSPGGVPIDGCGQGATISCEISCGDDLDCSSLDDQCNVGVCDVGTSKCVQIPVQGPACPVFCPATLDPFCLTAARAKLDYREKAQGKEQMNLRWQKIETATTLGGYGDPIAGDTSVATCIYDDAGALIQEFRVDRAGDSCSGKPCWKTKGSRGYGYQDKTASATGVSKIDYVSGGAGHGKAATKGKNNAAKGLTSLPAGVAAALSGNTAPTIQMLTQDGFCVGATLNEIKDDEPSRFRAQKK